MIQLLQHFSIVVAFSLVPVWCRLPDAPRPFAPHYITGFVVFIPIMLSIVAGLPRLKQLLQHPHKLRWSMMLILLLVWGGLTTNWAFMLDKRPEVLWSPIIQFSCVVTFALTTLSNPPSSRMIVSYLAVFLLINSIIGALQVAHQGSIGLFCEFNLDPQRSGVSVIQSGDIRWLRPYGLASHSNIFAGFIAVSLLISSSLILSEKRVFKWTGTFIVWFGLWILFLTFSRAAWLGFIVGAFVFLGLLLRAKAFRNIRQVSITLLGAVVLAGLFVWLYGDLLLTRAGISTEAEYTETRSIEERALFNQIAFTAIREYPLQGVGIGNLPWYVSYYLFYRTDTGMRGDNVHNIYLTAQGELGIMGMILFLGTVFYGFYLASKSYDVHQMAFISGVVILMVVGFFDHYPWTFIHYQVLWWGLIALSIPTLQDANPK